ncbi:MAG TPA: NAD(P)-binding domain-containing protein, partial [Pyrinomonadaceae bacterium]|nr:NAD(P)-binding domain-containing protein [Pyrinomonadaceae bacterium]
MSNEKWKMTQADPLNGARLSFIGCGVMAEAIIAGLLSKNLVKPEQIVGSHPGAGRRAELEDKYAIRVVESNSAAAGYHRSGASGYAPPSITEDEPGSSIVVLTVKPQRLGVILKELKGTIQADQLVISIVAGARVETIADALQHRAIVRAMPNTPAQI